MIAFPNCKINLGLQITGKRPDGYHDLETIFYPLAIRDVLEILVDRQPEPENSVKFIGSGIAVPGNQQDNLCVKAYGLLKKDFPSMPPVEMHLHKAIPMGAGLGGGSADAAFTLRLLNNLFRLDLSQEQLLDYALALGSDCPFFIINQPCFGKGRGEILSKVPLDLSGYEFALINPGIHISTAWAFQRIQPGRPSYDLSELILTPIDHWKGKLINDFEAPVCHQYPEIGQLIQSLYQSGARYAALSGTGSTVFGIFEKGALMLPELPSHYIRMTV